MASLVVDNEEEARNRFLAQKAQVNERQTAEEKKRLIDGKYRLEELQKLIPSIYEDKVLGKISLCFKPPRTVHSSMKT